MLGCLLASRNVAGGWFSTVAFRDNARFQIEFCWLSAWAILHESRNISDGKRGSCLWKPLDPGKSGTIPPKLFRSILVV